MEVAIINTGCANINSVYFALKRLGICALITQDQTEINCSDRVILPGVGSAEKAMNQLSELNLIPCIKSLTQPVLGICLGMQLFYRSTEEGNINCLGIIDEEIKRFALPSSYSIPHSGWNDLKILHPTSLFKNIHHHDVYFVHTYYAPLSKTTIASVQYGIEFTACMQFKNFIGCQFHPECSGQTGSKILSNFLEIT